MPYFFILPAFVLYIVVLSGGILLATYYGPASRSRPYLVSVLGWSCVGFVAATIVYVIVFVLSLLALRRFVHGPSIVAGVLMGLVTFVAPFVASAAGVLGGATFGIRRTIRRAETRP